MVVVYCYLCATVLLLTESWDQVMMGHECVVFKYADLGESAITRYNPKDRLTFSGSSPLPNLGVCSSAPCPAQLVCSCCWSSHLLDTSLVGRPLTWHSQHEGRSFTW